jgi:DNA gyrase subunit A
VFNTGKNEIVVSVAWIAEQLDDEDGTENGAAVEAATDNT